MPTSHPLPLLNLSVFVFLAITAATPPIHATESTNTPAATCACAPGTPIPTSTAATHHPLRGIVQNIMADKPALLVKHEAIPGVMGAMTMMLRVAPPVLEQVKKGDTITARLYRDDRGVWCLDQVTVVKT